VGFVWFGGGGFFVVFFLEGAKRGGKRLGEGRAGERKKGNDTLHLLKAKTAAGHIGSKKIGFGPSAGNTSRMESVSKRKIEKGRIDKKVH